MRKHYRLIVILTGFVLICSYQNFDVPDFQAVEEPVFESLETNPIRRLRDYAEFQMDDSARERLEYFHDKFEFDLGSSDDKNFVASDVSSEEPRQSTDVFKYSLVNLNTLRMKKSNTELDCRLEGTGVRVSWKQDLSETSSYVLEHNTREHKSEARIQFSW